MPSTTLLIGAGRMGRAHATALRELGHELTAICDTRQEALDEVGAAYDVPVERRFTDPAAMLAAFDAIDVVTVATTADTHAALTCAAAEAGAAAILCEKPMAASLEQCDRMLAACAAAGSRLAINHQMRFMDQYTLVRGLIEEGRIGRLASMNVLAGCFGLAMNGSHYVEAFNYLTGDWPVEASGWFIGEPVANPRGPAFFDRAGDFRLAAGGGQRLSLSIGRDQGHGMTVMYLGEHGHIFVDEFEGEAIVTSRKPEHRDAPTTRYGMPWDREVVRFPQADNVQPTKAVLAALLSGADYPDGVAGRHVVASIAACYASAENGSCPVGVDADGAAAGRTFPWA